MKFVIESSGYHRDDLLREYPFLVDYGFEMMEKIVPNRTRIRDERDNVIWQIGTRTDTIPCIHVNTLEELVDLSKKVGEGNSIIIHSEYNNVYDYVKNKWVGIGIPSIEIYDDYRE